MLCGAVGGQESRGVRSRAPVRGAARLRHRCGGTGLSDGGYVRNVRRPGTRADARGKRSIRSHTSRHYACPGSSQADLPPDRCLWSFWKDAGACRSRQGGAYAARWVAKNVVAAGLADRFEVEVAYGIGIARPISFSVESFGTGRIPDTDIQSLIERHFDLRPASIIAALDLRRPIYRQTAAYGHFGRPDLDLPWERTDKADLLRQDAGVDAAHSPVPAAG